MKHIPNLITLLNLLCGCIAIIFVFQAKLDIAACFVLIGLMFDFFDGFFARILNVQSAIGKELDSLADAVTFGVVPGLIMMQLFFAANQFQNSDKVFTGFGSYPLFNSNYLPLFGLLVTLASAYRLAKFNIDTRQTSSFIGLPTPANTLWIVSIPLIILYQPSYWILETFLNQWVLVGLTFLSCYLLNAEIPLFSLKFKSFGWNENNFKYIFLIASFLLLVFIHFLAIPIIVLLYILLSIFYKKTETNPV